MSKVRPMDIVNLGGEPKKDQQLKDGLQPAAKPVVNTPAIPAKPADISINFKPVMPGLEKKPDISSKPSAAWGSALDIGKETFSKPVENKPAVALDLASKPVISLDSKPSTASPAKAVEFFASSALQEKSGSSSKLIENIATQKAKLEQPKIENLLGKRSTILEKSIEEETQSNLNKKLRLVQFMAFFVAVVALFVNGFLFYQLNPGVDLLGYVKYNFDSNLRNDVYNLNQSLISVQTNLNKSRFLSGQLYLNQFGYESTRFIDGIAELNNPGELTDKAEIQSIIGEAKNHMPELLAGAKANLLQPLAVPTFKTRGEQQTDETSESFAFQADLRKAILADKTALKVSGAQSNIEISQQELSFYDNAIKLVGNIKLMSNLSASTVDAFKLEADAFENDKDAAQQQSFKQYIDNLLASTKVNLATIANLRNQRILWSGVLDRLEKISNDVNTLHNSGAGAGNESKIIYSGFDLDSNTGKIGINGTNTTSSGTNRAVMTFLIEALEASPEFKNISNRSFPLSKVVETDGAATYTMNFKIEMEIEKGYFSKLNAPIADFQAKTVAYTKVPVKK